MRKLILAALCLLLLLSASLFSGCADGGFASKDGGNRKLSVVTTIFPPYDFAGEIAGDSAELTLLLPSGTDPHSYEPSPKDIMKIKNCDLFIYIGGESDSYIKNILSSFDTPPRSLALMESAELLEEEITEGMEVDGEEDQGAPDEHIWTSLGNCVKMCEAIKNALSEISPADAEKFADNFDRYKTELSKLDEEYRAFADSCACKTLVFGDRFPFRYLADRYGFEYFAAFPGCSGESEPSAATVAFLIKKVREDKIPVVFYTETSSGNAARSIAEQTGARAEMLHSCHNITENDRKAGISFLSLMRGDLDVLKGALSDADN